MDLIGFRFSIKNNSSLKSTLMKAMSIDMLLGEEMSVLL